MFAITALLILFVLIVGITIVREIWDNFKKKFD